MWDEKDFLQGLQGLMHINTEYDADTADEKQPAGKNIAEGLHYIQKSAARDGFEVLTFDGHAIAILLGSQEKRVESVCHLDVVPAGSGWTVQPYGAVKKGNRLYGRGAQDMKTALWLNYTALKMIRSDGLQCKRQIRLVIGTAEERNMQDIVYYLQKAGLPDFAFTPDGSFPVCLGEKGDVVWYLDRPVTSRVVHLSAGQASNVICGLCTFSVMAGDEKKVLEGLAGTGFTYEMEKRPPLSFFHIKGKAAHTSLPHLGDNALLKALKVIHAAFSEDWAAQLICVFGDPYGGGLGLQKDYPPMGYASAGLNMFSLENGVIHGEADVRFPKPLNAAKLTELAQKALPGFALRNVYEEPVFLQSPDNPFVRTLVENYRSFYPGDVSEPYISGGVTYAKVYGGRCVACGPRLPFDTTPTLAHQADEYVSLDRMQELCRLYAGALYKLCNCEG